MINRLNFLIVIPFVIKSILEEIEGIGPKRRKELLRFFGDVGQVKSANVDEIAKVPGISRQLAQEIYDALHE